MVRQERRVWHIEGTLPPNDKRRYVHNFSVDVIAGSLEEAVQATRAKYPDMRFIKALADRYLSDLIIAGEPDGHHSS